VVAPPVEEFVFRGVLFAGFRRSWKTGAAGALVTLLFIAAHFTEVAGYGPAVIAVALVGAATLVARIATDSLAPAIALHASYNLGLVVALYAATA
jgi:membrane protease YdiL (CAAX protease family)